MTKESKGQIVLDVDEIITEQASKRLTIDLDRAFKPLNELLARLCGNDVITLQLGEASCSKVATYWLDQIIKQFVERLKPEYEAKARKIISAKLKKVLSLDTAKDWKDD